MYTYKTILSFINLYEKKRHELTFVSENLNKSASASKSLLYFIFDTI